MVCSTVVLCANVYKIFRKDNIDVQMLYRISRILHHNFFKDLSEVIVIH